MKVFKDIDEKFDVLLTREEINNIFTNRTLLNDYKHYVVEDGKVQVFGQGLPDNYPEEGGRHAGGLSQ